jgi:hypothetical protein
MICLSIVDQICVLVNGDIVCSCADPSGFRVYGHVYRNRLATYITVRHIKKCDAAAPRQTGLVVSGGEY